MFNTEIIVLRNKPNVDKVSPVHRNKEGYKTPARELKTLCQRLMHLQTNAKLLPSQTSNDSKVEKLQRWDKLREV
ncbi:hypothetical protein CDAR_592391 [Caerostris darwini]|uniref:Uncharacterized protein n=1 Tax=Caerostris darwini TaxID=1538125 RepID=A0AAV4TFE7_9ARAC|nr:hypothetical protein CDAR_592391 [Caerostris darwini]